MSVRSKILEAGIVCGTGQIFFYPSGGSAAGSVVSRDSTEPSVFSFTGAAQFAKAKAIELGIGYNEYYYAMQRLGSPTTNLEDFETDITFLDENAGWLWGSVETGGVGCFFANDPLHPNEVMIFTCCGLYGAYINNELNYRYYLNIPTEPVRTIEQSVNAVILYPGDQGGVHLICASGSIPMNVFNPETQAYDIQMSGDMNNFAVSNKTTITLVPPFYAHLTAFDLNAEGVEGGFNDLPAIYDDEYGSPYPPEWEHLAGHWYGGSSLQPNPNQRNQDEGDWKEEDYSPSEDDRKETEEDQFEIDAINSGLVTIFNPTQNQVTRFSRFLFSGITEDIASFFKRLMSSPLDYIISMSLVHYKPQTDGAAEIKFGGIGSGVASLIVKDQMQKIEYGTVSIGRQFSSYLDYGGYSKLKIYLPYCGKHEIDCDLSVGADITLTYWVDNLSGACVAQLTYYRGHIHGDDRTQGGQVYEFTGNVFEELPLSASDYRAVISGALTAVTGAASVAMGNPSGVGAIASGVMNMKPNIQHGGKVGSNFGYMGSQYAYIEVTRPNPADPPDYYKYNGMNASWSYQLKDLSGFQKVRPNGIKLNDLRYATENEIMKLKKLFEEGVML